MPFFSGNAAGCWTGCATKFTTQHSGDLSFCRPRVGVTLVYESAERKIQFLPALPDEATVPRPSPSSGRERTDHALPQAGTDRASFSVLEFAWSCRLSPCSRCPGHGDVLTLNERVNALQHLLLVLCRTSQ